MKRAINFLTAASLFAVLFVSCKVDPVTSPKLKIEADKLTIIANGEDKVTFTVLSGEKDVTAEASIVSNGTTQIQGHTFSTTEVGTYKFHAFYEGRSSDEITVKAEDTPEIEFVLAVENNEIYDNNTDEARFTAKLDGADITDEVKICQPNSTCLIEPVFRSETAGEYRFYASYELEGETITSNNVTVNVKESPKLTLVPSRLTLLNDNADQVVFIVKLDDKDVSKDAEIFSGDNAPLASNVFSTSTAGEYEFYAKYTFNDKDMETEPVNVTAITLAGYDQEKELVKNVAFITWTATWCGPCGYFKRYMKNVIGEHGDNIVQVNIQDTTDDIGGHTSLNPIISQLRTDKRFSVNGFPTSFAEWRKSVGEDGYVPSEENILECYDSYSVLKVKTGIRVSSEINNGKIIVNVTLGAREAGDYSVAVFLTEDHIQASQTNGGGSVYDHTNVARMVATNVFGKKVGAMTAGQTIDKEFYFNLLSTFNIDNLNLVVYTLYEEEGNMVIDNTVKAPVRDIFDFVYAD